MKKRTAARKGAILLQTLVMSIILSLIAVMIMKWVLARYQISARMQRSSAANTRVSGCAQYKLSSWAFTTGMTPSGAPCSTADYDSKNISVAPVGTTVTFTTDEDQ